MVQREAVLRLDDQWARVRSGAEHAAPGERDRLLDELIGALRPFDDDPRCTALLGLRLADRAALRFAAGDRAGALATIEEGLRSSERAAGQSPEFARWYARGLINHGVWLAWPLSDGARLPKHPLGPAAGEGPSAMERAAGERARDLTRTAVGVWAALDQQDPVNRRGLAQAKVFLGDRLAELGSAEEAVAWAVAAESDFRQLLLADPAAEESGRRRRLLITSVASWNSACASWPSTPWSACARRGCCPNGCCPGPWWPHGSRGWRSPGSPPGWVSASSRCARCWRSPRGSRCGASRSADLTDYGTYCLIPGTAPQK